MLNSKHRKLKEILSERLSSPKNTAKFNVKKYLSQIGISELHTCFLLRAKVQKGSFEVFSDKQPDCPLFKSTLRSVRIFNGVCDFMTPSTTF